MLILSFYEGEKETFIAVFEDRKSAAEFVEKIPSYKKETEVFEDMTFTYESFCADALPVYMEIEYNGHRIPISRYMFDGTGQVEITWREMPNLSAGGNGLVDGATRVDAYSVNNEEVKDYIDKRERKWKLAHKIFDEMGYVAERAYHGSEDGEAILFYAKSSDNPSFFMHMDPFFVEEFPEEEDAAREWIKQDIEERKY